MDETGCPEGIDCPGRGSADWWNEQYLAGNAPWDSGIVAPELVALLRSGLVRPGWALDLGCGSGLNSCYLAEHGFRVVGVDLAHAALVRAAQAARQRGLPAWFVCADVADLSCLRLSATFALDIGCFHSLSPERGPAYAASLAAHLLPGAYYLLYAFEPSDPLRTGEQPGGVGPAELAVFAGDFSLVSSAHGRDRDRLSAWHLLQRM